MRLHPTYARESSRRGQVHDIIFAWSTGGTTTKGIAPALCMSGTYIPWLFTTSPGAHLQSPIRMPLTDDVGCRLGTPVLTGDAPCGRCDVDGRHVSVSESTIIA